MNVSATIEGLPRRISIDNSSAEVLESSVEGVLFLCLNGCLSGWLLGFSCWLFAQKRQLNSLTVKTDAHSSCSFIGLRCILVSLSLSQAMPFYRPRSLRERTCGSQSNRGSQPRSPPHTTAMPLSPTATSFGQHTS